MYLASWDVALHAAKSLVIIWIFLFCDYKYLIFRQEWGREWMPSQLTALPEVIAISVSCAKTNGTVRGLGLKSVRWLFFEFYIVWNNHSLEIDPPQMPRTEREDLHVLLPRAPDHQLLLGRLWLLQASGPCFAQWLFGATIHQSLVQDLCSLGKADYGCQYNKAKLKKEMPKSHSIYAKIYSLS